MKCLFFLSLAFLLFLSSEVSSQNQNMFDFEINCYDTSSLACSSDVFGIYEQAGQIISDNLVLNQRIKVIVIISNGDGSFIHDVSTPFEEPYGDLDGGTEVNYPTALIKQIDPNFQYYGNDIVVSINSRYDSDILYNRNDPIAPNQFDLLELVLHELIHGLGIYTHLDYVIGDNLYPDVDFDLDDEGDGFTFDSLMETVFDKYLVSLDNNNEQIVVSHIHDLNNMAGPSNRHYNNFDDFFNNLRDQQQQQGKTYGKDLLNMATNSNKLGFKPNDADVIKLDTSENPLVKNINIMHLDTNTYLKTSDFLLVSSIEPGKKLEDKIQAYGNAPGGGIGPYLRIMLTSLGYQSRI